MTHHFQVPFAVVDGSTALVRQDSDAEISQCVRVLCETTPGDRQVVPDYGIDDETWRPVDLVDGSEVMDALLEWEPRADADVAATVAAEVVRLEVS